MVEISQIRELLLKLLDRHAGEERLQGELRRARREFFGEERPAYASDEESLELAAIRFAEWYLLERSSDQLGEVPVRLLMQAIEQGEDVDADPELLGLLATSRAGVYIAESAQEKTVQLRDLQGGERLELSGIPESVDPGDIVIGRLFEIGAGTWLPSLALAILPASPELAIAYQKDLRRLNLDRRLSQAELEHLLFRRWAENRQSPAEGPPLERLEAELETLLLAADLVDEYPSAAISAALKDSPDPGVVIGPILDQLAFDSDVDLEALQRILIQIWTRQNQSASPAEPETPKAQAPVPEKQSSGKAPRTGSESNQGGLGERLAARLDAGLARKENIEELFKDLEGMLGEGDLDGEVENPEGIGSDAGDLEALVREFVWEENLQAAEEATLARFIQSQQETPLPKNVVEYLEEDDVLRFLLQNWLGSDPEGRLGHLRGQAAILDRFFAWVRATQCVELNGLREFLDHPLIREADRLDAAAKALSTSDRPDGSNAEEVELMRVTQVMPGELSLVLDRSHREVDAMIPARASGHLQADDLMLGRFEDIPGRGRLLGMVVVLPGKLQHLLG
ncbi:MAG: hypothetical protein ACYTG5_02715 [Planctomycetota bacterium]